MRSALLMLMVSAGPALAQKKPPNKPVAGEVYHCNADAPKWMTADGEFRHPDEAKWPSFVYGKPSRAGTFTFQPEQPKIDLAVTCAHMAQAKGDPSFRVLGELVRPNMPVAVTIAVSQAGPFAKETRTRTENGKTKTDTIEFFPVELTIGVGGPTAVVAGKATVRYTNSSKREAGPDTAFLDFTGRVPGKELGLTAAGATGPLGVRLQLTMYTTPPTKAPK
jgi:hypothetical protein